MKRKMVVLAGMVVLCLGLVGTQASWANSLTFQDVMFNLNDTGGNTLTLEVNDVLSASGNWTGIDHLESFSLKGLGVTTLTLAGWTDNGLELNSSGCTGGGSGGFCFDFDANGFTLADDNTFVMNYTGTLDLDSNHLKVLFSGAEGGNYHGDLLSQGVVPVPGTLLMFGLGFALFIGWHQRVGRMMRVPSS